MRCVVSGFAILVLAGCAIFEDEVQRGFAQNYRFTTPAAYTTADIRMISERVHPVTGRTVICTEPTPDVAKALSAAAQFGAKGGDAATTGSLAGGGATGEAVMALAGRSTALLGLRDGLFRACEAFANGALGADAYALILSRYGQLMTTLFLGQDITGAAGTQTGAAVQSPSVSVNVSGDVTGASSVTGAQPPNQQGGAGQQGGTGQNPVEPGPLALTRMNEDYMSLDYNLGSIVIACINYGDHTRIPAAPNRWLDQICPQLMQVAAFERLGKGAIALAKGGVLAPPVNPIAAGGQAAQRK
jgi:hypothetical protein